MKNVYYVPPCLLLSLSCLSMQAMAQEEAPVLATSKTSIHRESPRVREVKTKTYIQIVTTSMRETGYGNRCATDAARRMGFEYVPMPIGEVKRKSTLHYFFHNQAARLQITFKNGPFWQWKQKRYMRECRRTTGDFTG